MSEEKKPDMICIYKYRHVGGLYYHLQNRFESWSHWLDCAELLKVCSKQDCWVRDSDQNIFTIGITYSGEIKQSGIIKSRIFNAWSVLIEFIIIRPFAIISHSCHRINRGKKRSLDSSDIIYNSGMEDKHWFMHNSVIRELHSPWTPASLGLNARKWPMLNHNLLENTSILDSDSQQLLTSLVYQESCVLPSSHRDATSVSCPHHAERNYRTQWNPKLPPVELTGHLAQEKASIIFQRQQDEMTQLYCLGFFTCNWASLFWLVGQELHHILQFLWVVPQHIFFPQSCLGKHISPKALNLKFMPGELPM